MTINRTKTTTPWPMPSTAGTAAGQSSMEMDPRFSEAFDRTTRVAAVYFRKRGHILSNELEGLKLPRQDLRIENASTGVDQ
jgi:hypothetical protein